MTTISIKTEQLVEFKRQKLKYMASISKEDLSDWEFFECLLNKTKGD